MIRCAVKTSHRTIATLFKRNERVHGMKVSQSPSEREKTSPKGASGLNGVHRRNEALPRDEPALRLFPAKPPFRGSLLSQCSFRFRLVVVRAFVRLTFSPVIARWKQPILVLSLLLIWSSTLFFSIQLKTVTSMGNTDSKVDFRVAVVQLTSHSQVRTSLHRYPCTLTFCLSSKSSRMTNPSGINSGLIRSPVSKTSSHWCQPQRYALCEKNCRPI